jgi:hypothetical protein
MRKLWMLLFAVLLAATIAVAQDQDSTAKQDTESAGHHVKNAAKDTAHATKKGAEAVGHGVKKGAVATKDAVTGHHGDDARSDNAERRDNDENRAVAQDQDRDHDRNRRNLPQSEGYNDRVMDRNARNVHIINGPDVDARDRSATLRWQTDGLSTNDVWLEGGNIRGHRTLYDRHGSRDHVLTFSNLRPNTTYHYIIRTRDGDVRQEGSFTTR